MKQIKAKELTHENFRKYGTFCKLEEEFSNDEINNREGFIIHRDVILQNLGNTTMPAFFTCFFRQDKKIVNKLDIILQRLIQFNYPKSYCA